MSCGNPIAPGARFCAFCGQSVRVTSEERRVVTILFADLVGFTGLSESLDPEQVKHLIDAAFQRLVHDVVTFGGRVDKIVGDAIVALFGAPIAHEDDAERAVRAALRMQSTLAHFAEEHGESIRMRIGVNTGEVLVGSLRAGGDYTAMGDVVNIANRLQTMAAPSTVLVGDATRALTIESIDYESLGEVELRGREQGIEAWLAVRPLALPGHRSRRRTTLIGRDDELELLQGLASVSMTHSRGQFVLLLGDAGVGKSRLTDEMQRIVCDRVPEALVLNGRCLPYGESNPWWPIAEVLREACGIESEDPADIAKHKCLAAVDRLEGLDDAPSVVNGLLHLLGYDGPVRALEPMSARTEAIQSMLAFLEAGLRRRPILVRLADLHWADEEVLAFIAQVGLRLGRLPFVLVATARTELMDRWSATATGNNTLILHLDPLSREASEQLLDALLEHPLEESVRGGLLDRSGGNPFYLEELTTLLEEDPLADATGLPDTLRGLVAARIDALTINEQKTLEDAAVWGAEGPVLALSEISRLSNRGAEIDAVIDGLVSKEVFTVEGGHWAFRSDLVREVAYGRLTKFDRQTRHLKIAQHLVALGSGRFMDNGFVELVARHFGEAQRLSAELGAQGVASETLVTDTRLWSAEAARRFEQTAAWPTVDRHLTVALSCCVDGEDEPERLGYLLSRSHARGEMWRLEEAKSDAVEALELAERLDGPLGRARSHLCLGELAGRLGNSVEAIAELSDSLQRFDQLNDRSGQAHASRALGMAELFRSAPASAEPHITRALEAYREVQDQRGQAWALQNLAWIAFVSGDVEAAEHRLGASSAAFRKLGDPGGLLWTDGLLAFLRLFQGRLDEARAIATRTSLEGQRRGERWGEAMMMIVLGAVQLWEGETAEAVRSARRSVGLFRDLGDAVGLEDALGLLSRALVMSGEIQEGVGLAQESVAAHRDSSAVSGVLGVTIRTAIGVQLGDLAMVDGTGGLDVLRSQIEGGGRSDQEAGLILGYLQTGRLSAASELIGGSADGGSPLAPSMVAAGAMVAACLGDENACAVLAGRLEELHPSTYIDRLLLGISQALCRPEDFRELLRQSTLELDGTGDKLHRAILNCCKAAIASTLGEVDARQLCESSSLELAELGIRCDGWKAVFQQALSHWEP